MDGDLLHELLTKTSVPLWPTAGRACGLGRNATYKAAREGKIPVNDWGGKKTSPTAPLRRLLGIELPGAA